MSNPLAPICRVRTGGGGGLHGGRLAVADGAMRQSFVIAMRRR